MRTVEPYPFEELDRRKAAARQAGRTLIDFGVGDPREETPAFIRQALRDAVAPTSSYPRAAGLPELRDAIAGWVGRRFGAHPYSLFGAHKTVEGSVAFFVTTLPMAWAATVFAGADAQPAAVVAVVVSLVLTAAEGVLGWGLDNLVLPTLAAMLVGFAVR
jgi:hypothetical protein